MASTRNKVWGPTHPSAAFLIKCAKEKEKLRSTLQNQLQEHLLCMLQSKLFSDTLIGVSTLNPQNLNENKIQKHPDLPHLVHAHKAVLKVRTPAFYNHLTEHQQSNLGVESYDSFLQEAELEQFLRKTYTDDDIRKHECEALHLSKKYIELLCLNKGPLNKHILEADEFEKESVNSTCTDNFVTPKTSPVSPEGKLDVSTMFGSAQNKIDAQKNLESISLANGSMKKNENWNESNITTSEKEIKISSPIELMKIEMNKAESPQLGHVYNDGNLNESRESELSLNIDMSNSDQDSESEDFPNVGSMVRSNTFDLETQGSLEDAIDDSNDWCYRDMSGKNSGETEKSRLQLRECLPSKRTENTGFYLHDHTPSPKSNIFKNSFLKESSHGVVQEPNSRSPNSNIHYRRIDGSMSDSGFMSHSTFSVMSDTPYPNSITSSLVMSQDSMSNSPVTNVNVGSNGDTPKSAKSELSGSMFPFYIDIKKLSPPSQSSTKMKKSSPSHTYMYIDAKSPRMNAVSKRRPFLNGSYDELFSEIDSGTRTQYKKQETLMKAQSTSHLDVYQYEQKQYKASEMCAISRPQSCYMYVDLDTVEYEPKNQHPEVKLRYPPAKQEPTAVSMFIDLNEDPKENSAAFDDAKTNFASTNWGRESQHSGRNSSELDDRLPFKPQRTQRRKLSDPSLPNLYNSMENRIRYFSLNREGRSKSASSDHPLNLQENFLHMKNSTPRKSRSAYRYSDGIYYDNFYQKRITNNLYNPFEKKICNDLQSHQTQHIKFDYQTTKLIECLKNDTSGSCSDLGKADTSDKSLSDEKVRWRSTGDMGKTKCLGNKEENGLLPMSPILRRKSHNSEPSKPPSPTIAVKASTKPQDVDAMTFPKSLREDSPKICNRDPKEEFKPGYHSPLALRKKLEISDDSKSSSDSLKQSTETANSNCTKSKTADSLSKSGSSHMTISGDDLPLDHEAVREKIASHSPLTLSMSCDFEEDSETMYSEVSDVSSSLGGVSGVASLERRWRESQNQQAEFNNHNVKSSQRALEACSKLGEDLLRMFLEEIDADITIEVEEKLIKAHRCILAVRCQYFSNLLRANNSDKDTDSISLEGFSYLSVHFALCHIYSGAMNIPKECNISELTLLADMLHLDTLRDVIVFHLKMHYCHFFHRPCLQCSQGVVECLPLASACGLNELRDKCIYWLGKNFTRTWTNKSFAALPEELQDLCYNVTIQNLTIDSVIDMTLNCDRLINTLPQLKWTEAIFGMITKLLQDCIHFMAANFNPILKSEGFLALGKGQSWNVTALEEDVISAIELTAPDMACKSFDTVNHLIQIAESVDNAEFGIFTQNFVDLLHKISRHCERYLIQNANKVVHCQSWACLAPQVQKRIKDAAVIVFEFEKPTAPPPRLSSLQRKLKKQSDLEDSGCLERSTYPKKGKVAANSRKQQREFSPKNSNLQCSPELSERTTQRRETDNIMKKIVSPIKEEVNYNSLDTSTQDISYEIPVGPPFPLQARNQLLNKVYLDEDSLRDLQDLPQDQTHSNHYEPESESQMISSIASLEMDDSRSPAHCSDNPDSLEANEEISSDSKEEVDVSVSAEDGSSQEKGANEKPEVPNKNSIESVKKENIENLIKSSISPPKSPKPPVTLNPVKERKLATSSNSTEVRERSPVKKGQGKSLVPLLKTYTSDEKLPITPDSKGKDLVAEIDADSRMVSHCLQEAEMLEQQLSRKLQRQHQDGSSTGPHYLNSPARIQVTPENHKAPKTYGSRLQKASSTSQIKNFVSSSSRGRSPGRAVKSNASSPSIGHPPKLLKCNESVKDKNPLRKSSISPKSTGVSHGSFRSAESIAKQVSTGVQITPKRVPTRINRSKIITVSNVRTSVTGPK